MTPVRIIVCAVWLVAMVAAALTGKVSLYNGQPLRPLPALVVGPLIALIIGAGFVLVGAAFTAPIWIWWVR